MPSSKIVTIMTPLTNFRSPIVFRNRLMLSARNPSWNRLTPELSASGPCTHSCANHVCCHCFSLACRSLRSGFVAITDPPVQPISMLGWQGLHGASADAGLDIRATALVAKNRRRLRRRTKSFSSLVTNEWSQGE